MKKTKLRKSWDEVFPDGHIFSLKTERRHFPDRNIQGLLARHWRSNSAVAMDNLPLRKIWSQSFRFPKESYSSEQEGHPKKKQSHDHRLASLKKDVAELQAKFESEQAKKRILKKALQKASSIPSLKDLTPKTMQDLVEEIATLELEVTNLEQHLLKLYRQAFTQCYKSSAYGCKSLKLNASESTKTQPVQNQSLTGNWQDIRQRSSLWVSEHYMTGRDPSEKARNLHYSHSQPILFPQVTSYQNNFAKCFINKPLAEKTSSDVANRLSEDLVRCMATLYCRLAQPSVLPQEPSISPLSTSSASTFSAQRLSSDEGSSQPTIDTSYDMSFGDFNNRNYITETTSAFQVQWIYVNDERLADVAPMLRKFQFLVQKLDSVDPSKMNHAQKLAFWINVHNVLVMHAYLAYGIPRNHLKRISLLQKAAYRIGAHTISAQTIQQSILKCRPYRPAKWLHSILLPAAAGGGRKWKGEERMEYAIQYPEPLLCFALCYGSRSDPAVRVYTDKLIYHELEGAKQEFLRAHVIAHRNGKVCLPSILQSFAKNSSLKLGELLEWIGNQMENDTTSFIAMCTLDVKGKTHKCIEWQQHDFTFQYMFAYPFAI